jgi:hypothetical protein
MKNIVKLVGNLNRARSAKVPLLIIVIVTAIGFTMLTCVSMPEGSIESTLKPDASSAIIYFLQPSVLTGGGDLTIWDGENPVSNMYAGLYRNVSYRAMPGTHYFLGKRFNWSNAKIEVRANNIYYIRLNWAPNPIPYANNMIILEIMSQKDGLEQYQKNDKTITFTEEWRKDFKNKMSKEDLAELRKNLSEARK